MNWILHKCRAFRGCHPFSRKIFILGCGRAGTHWLGYILQSHPHIVVTIEKPAIFERVTEMALDFSTKKQLLPKVIRRYRWEHARVAPLHYADKSHPNLWMAEQLSQAFDDALFIGIQREPYATVASMLKHKSVSDWCRGWKEFPVPNPFLGITEENRQTYESLSLAGRCAMRWKSHTGRMKQLYERLGDRIFRVQYEDLSRNTPHELGRLEEFLHLVSPIPVPEVKPGSLEKWRHQLTSAQCADIEKITGRKNPA